MFFWFLRQNKLYKIREYSYKKFQREQGKYLLNGYFFESIAKSRI